MILRTVRVFIMGLAGTVAALSSALLALATLGLAAYWKILVLQAPAADFLERSGTVMPGNTPLIVCAGLWLGFGALFLRYQLRTDRLALAAARREDTGAAVSFAGLADILVQSFLLLLAGPLVIVLRAFQRPLYAWVSCERHYRSRLIYTAGRRRAAVGRDAIIVFDSKSYLFGQMLELIFWAALFYALFFEPGPAIGAGA